MIQPLWFSKLEPAERERIYGWSRISLCQKPEGRLGLQYLTEKRGLDIDTIAKFRLGFIPFSYDHAFSGRIVMPIFDDYDQLIALSVRPIYQVFHLKAGGEAVAYDPIEKNGSYIYRDAIGALKSLPCTEVTEIEEPSPKYWNESFAKGEQLYGMNIAKYEIVRLGFAIIVEGQFDIMLMHAHGFGNTVGLLGGAFTPIHAMLLRRWTRNNVILTDGDNAGRSHAKKIQEVLDIYCHQKMADTAPKPKKSWEKEKPKSIFRNVKYCIPSLMEGYDPASYLLRHGSGPMRSLLRDSMAQASIEVPKGW